MDSPSIRHDRIRELPGNNRTTEHLEGIAAGTLKLVGAGEEHIYSEFKRLLTDAEVYNALAHAFNPVWTDRPIKVLWIFSEGCERKAAFYIEPDEQ